MSKSECFEKLIETDVLIVGGGVAGLWAANRARELRSKVLVVDKGPRDWGGLASMAGGDFDAVLPDENIDDFIKDLVYYWDGLCEQDLMEEILSQSYDRLKDYERLGCKFLRTPDGKLKGIPQRSLDHVKLYPAEKTGTGGEDMVRGLIMEAKRLGVERMGRTLLTDLLKREGRIVGAVGFNTITGEFYVFKAGAVVLATGAGGWKPSYHLNTSTGEGTHMAYRAGAEMRNFEFLEVWNVPSVFAWEGQTTLLPLGAKFVNSRDEPFMDKYSPVFGADTDPHYNVIGMSIEAKDGRTPVFFDTTGIKAEDLSLVKPDTGWQLLNYRKLVKLGIDLFTQKTEWMPQLDISFGGLVADIEGRTSVPGLFVAGRARSIDPGVYIGGFALCVTAVTGHITGQAAADFASIAVPLELDKEEIAALKKNTYKSMRKEGIPPSKVLAEIREIIFPYDVCIIKSKASLEKALKRFEHLKTELLSKMTAQDSHYLMKLIEVQAIAFFTEMYLRTSLLRTETRAGHYREDFPERDDDNWLKWIVFGLKDKGLKFWNEPVPFERYKFKPTRYYMDNFTFSQ